MQGDGIIPPVSRGTPRRVMRRRAQRAASALTVVAFTALGQSGGSGFMPASHTNAIGRVVDATTLAAPLEIVAAPVGAVPGDDATGVPTAEQPTVAVVPTVTAVAPGSPTGSGIPSTVLAAYKAAEATLAGTNPNCHVSWSLIAGIGRVESGNASGGRVDAAGTTNGRILGPRLDGTANTAVIRDTDGGSMDTDPAFDRAVGPMQFIPSTWKTFAKDGNRDGVANPHNIYDAALSAGSYLCASGGDLSQPAAQRAALLRYNRSDAYAALVMRWAASYAAGASTLPDQTGQVPTTAPTPPTQVPAPAPVENTAAGATVAALAAVSDDSSTTTTPTTTTTPSTTTTTPATTTKPTTTKPTTTVPVTTTPPKTTPPKTTPPTSSSSEEPTPSSEEPTSSSEETSTKETSTEESPEESPETNSDAGSESEAAPVETEANG